MESETLMKQTCADVTDKKLILLWSFRFVVRNRFGNTIPTFRVSGPYSTIQTYCYQQISRILL